MAKSFAYARFCKNLTPWKMQLQCGIIHKFSHMENASQSLHFSYMLPDVKPKEGCILHSFPILQNVRIILYFSFHFTPAKWYKNAKFPNDLPSCQMFFNMSNFNYMVACAKCIVKNVCNSFHFSHAFFIVQNLYIISNF